MVPQKFILGVWQQPASSFSKWAGRGCNCLVDLQQGALRSEVLAVAEDQKFGVIIAPDPIDPRMDLHYKSMWGWLQKPDEPENPEHVPTLDANGRKDYMAAAQAWKDKYATLKVCNAALPVIGNFNGMILTAARETVDTSKPPTEQNIVHAEYSAFMDGCDYVSADWHVRNSNRTSDKIVDLYQKMMGRLRLWSNVKPSMAVVECAFENRVEKGPAPSAADLRAEVWSAIIFGAQGIIYFPAKIGGGYLADNMTPELVAEMQRINAEIKQAEPYLIQGDRLGGYNAQLASGSWQLGGQTMNVHISWNGTSWDTTVDIPPSANAAMEENTRLKAKLAEINKWRASFPV